MSAIVTLAHVLCLCEIWKNHLSLMGLSFSESINWFMLRGMCYVCDTLYLWISSPNVTVRSGRGGNRSPGVFHITCYKSHVTKTVTWDLVLTQSTLQAAACTTPTNISLDKAHNLARDIVKGRGGMLHSLPGRVYLL